MIPLAIWCNEHLQIFRLQIALALRARAILLSLKNIYSSLFTPNCTRNHVLPKLNEGRWPSQPFMALHELVKFTENQSKLQAMTEYYDIG